MDSRDVMPWAEVLLKRLSPACSQITLAGSLRRGKADVKDIEVVAVPHPTQDLFGEASDGPTELDNLIDTYVADEMLHWDKEVKRNGPRYKRLVSTALDLPIDLFLADRDNWGNILAIRTGAAGFSKALVTSRCFGGLMPEYLRHRDGYLWTTRWDFGNRRTEERLSCPDEETYFALLGLPCLPPMDRRAEMAGTLRREFGGAR